MNLVINILYPLITIIVSTFFIYGVKLYITTKNINYIIGSIIGALIGYIFFYYSQVRSRGSLAHKPEQNAPI